MYCEDCGSQLPETGRFCTDCGAERLTVGRVQASPVTRRVQAVSNIDPPQPPPVTAPPPTVNFDVRQWTRSDLIAGGGTLVQLIALFLPWFSIQFFYSLSASAVSVHSWMYLDLVLCLAVLGYLVLRAISPGRVRLPMAHWQAMTTATGLAALFVLIGFLDKPGGSSWDYGAFIGVIAATVAVVGSVLRRNEPETAGTATPTTQVRRSRPL